MVDRCGHDVGPTVAIEISNGEATPDLSLLKPWALAV
jgi:hypothetical protein